MAQLLVSTPEYLLRYDVAERRTWIIEGSRQEYYGISWFSGADDVYLSHSGIDNASENSLEAYITSEVGWISAGERESWPFLSAPHQILCVENETLLATNTGRNCLTLVNARDWSIRNFRYSDALWDRYGTKSNIGNHLNSVFYRDGFVYVVAHNFDRNSFTLKLEWPSLRLVEAIPHSVSGIHNFWVRDDAQMFACDTMSGGLIEVASGRTLWTCDDNRSLTRGLAATATEIFVGVSENGPRASRRAGETGIWILDAGTFATRDYHSLGRWGGVHEVRLLDVPDLCHPNGPLQLTSNMLGTSPEVFLTARRVSEVQERSYAAKHWDIILGTCTASDPTSITFTGDDLGVAVRREITASDIHVTGTLDVSGRSSNLAALVVCYHGPGDTNMVSAILQREPLGIATLSLWCNSNEVWTQLGSYPASNRHVAAELLVNSDFYCVRADGADVITVARVGAPVTQAGRVGVRAIRGAVRNFQVNGS